MASNKDVTINISADARYLIAGVERAHAQLSGLLSLSKRLHHGPDCHAIAERLRDPRERARNWHPIVHDEQSVRLVRFEHTSLTKSQVVGHNAACIYLGRTLDVIADTETGAIIAGE